MEVLGNRIAIGAFLAIFFIPWVSEAKKPPPPCQVAILEVTEATVGRGPPYMMQILQRNPERAALITAESHGDHHLHCEYKVDVNGRAYLYLAEFSNTFQDLQAEDCDSKKIRGRVKEGILSQTGGCRNIEAVPVWGGALKPIR